jgi:hypothetical protein
MHQSSLLQATLQKSGAVFSRVNETSIDQGALNTIKGIGTMVTYGY